MSFIKWVGGKSKLIDKITPKISEGETYYEPFLGSGSVLFYVLEHKLFKKYIVSDINKPLICVYGMIKTNLNNLIDNLNNIKTNFENSEDKETFYYEIRKSYNEDLENIVRENNFLASMSAKFIFLNKTCFRGLYRVNNKGLFNVPYGNYKNPNIFDNEELQHLNQLFNENDIEFKNCDYKKILSNINPEDFVYLDPPYINTYDSYSVNGFDSEDFANVVNNLNCKCLLSNSEDFKKYLDKKFKIENLTIQNKINSKSPGSTRTEILAFNF